MRTGKLWLSSWVMLGLIIGFVGGCGAIREPFLTAPAPVASPISSATPTRSPVATPAPSVTPTQPPVVTPVPSATPTQPPAPTSGPQPTPTSGAKIELTVLDCSSRFCPPEELERAALNVAEKPGILAAMPRDESRIRLIYDPTQLTEEEVIQIFEDTTGLEVTQ